MENIPIKVGDSVCVCVWCRPPVAVFYCYTEVLSSVVQIYQLLFLL